MKQLLLIVIIALIVGIIGFVLGKHTSTNNHSATNSETHHNMSDMSMENMMMDMNAALYGKTGNEFDQAFLKEMIVHHQGAVDMAELVLTSSDRPELKNLANEIITAQKAEIAQMKTWQQEWTQ